MFFHMFGYLSLRAAPSPAKVIALQTTYDYVVAGIAAQIRDAITKNTSRMRELEPLFPNLIGRPVLMAATRQIDSSEFLSHYVRSDVAVRLSFRPTSPES